MAHRKSLNEKQVDVLRWIADGRPAGVMEAHAHLSGSAAHRGLVETSGRGAAWSAMITAAGREYLERAAGPNAPKPRQASVSVTQQLVDEVIAARGSLRVPRRSYWERDGVDYKNRARLAERHGKVPDGKRLRVTAVSPEELQIDLIDPPEGMPSARPVPVLQRVARYHPVVRQFKERTESQEISRAALPRALRVLHALVSEAEHRDHDTQLATSSHTDGYGRPHGQQPATDTSSSQLKGAPGRCGCGKRGYRPAPIGKLSIAPTTTAGPAPRESGCRSSASTKPVPPAA